MSLLARHLDRACFEPMVVSLHSGGSMASAFDDSDVRVFSAAKEGRRDIVGFVSRVRRILRQAQPDVVYSFTDYPNVLNQALHFLGGDYRAVWGLRASDNKPATRDFVWRSILAASRPLSSTADLLISNSDAGRAYYEDLGYPRGRIHVIPNGIDTQRFAPDRAMRERLRADWDVGNKLVFGFVGRLHPKKGVGIFLEAARATADKHPDSHFVVAGNDNDAYGRKMRSIAAPLIAERRLTWLGERHDINAVMNALDVFTLTSTYGEGFPNVLGEAMATGLPVLATDVGDAAAVLGDASWLVKLEDATSVQANWDSVLAMPAADRAELATRNRRRIVEHYSVKRMVDRSSSLISDLVLSGCQPRSTLTLQRDLAND